MPLFLGGCSKEIQVDGIAFSANKKGEVTKYKGMKIYFLSNGKISEAIDFVEMWRYEESNRRSDKFNKELSAYEQKRENYNSTSPEKRNPATRKYLEDKLVGLKIQKSMIDMEGYYPHGKESFTNFLKDQYFVITDEKGEFTATLQNGKKYLVIAEGPSLPGDDWFFEFIAEPQKLILTASNSVYGD